ncbi:MAG: DUF1800 domain-containing protein [Thermoanaerobaculia bacterium]|nr:DUF1800 domain-containing protein [Thermoanaerobaculia bacterium]
MKHCPRRSFLLTLLFLSAPLAAQSLPQTKFFPIPPCRVADTRNPAGAFGAPALAAGSSRTYTLVGTCGIPASARSVNMNIAVVMPSAAGSLAVVPGGAGAGSSTAISYRAGKTRANNFIARLGSFGDIAVYCQQPTGTTDFLIDVSGYFEDVSATPVSTFTAFAGFTTFGASPALTAHIRDVGMSAFLDEQFAAPPSNYVQGTLFPNNQPGTCTGNCPRDNYTMYPLQGQFYFNALYGGDQLRQRVAWALHKIIPINGQDIGQSSRNVPYLNILANNAFGNYRNILYQITLNAAMGQYLNMNTSTLQLPNENYVRELLQLFSIGLVKLNLDGTPQLSGGEPIETYNQAAITEGARVFTGWRLAPPISIAPLTDDYVTPMVLVDANHDKGAKTLYNGTVLPCRGPVAPCSTLQTADKDLNDTIDAVFNDPNVGPYIGGSLIRNLVTSNPSPAYVARIAAKFNDNGSGVRGDLAAVVRAIVTDSEALAGATDPNFGALREPAFFAIALLRGLGARSANGLGLSDGVISPQVANLGQTVFQPDTVFSYFPADYLTPGTTLYGPEFGILSASTALRRANLVNTLVYSTIPVGANNPSGTSLDMSGIQTLAGDPAGMVEELNRRLCHGLLSAGAKTAIVNAVNAAPTPRAKAQQATYLVATSSQFQVER